MNIFKPYTERFPMSTRLASETGKPIVFLDTETTGLLNRPPVGIVDIGVLVIQPNGKASVLDVLVDPELPIPVEASKIHGIYAKDVAGAETFASFISFFKDHFESSIISGFNSRQYDIPVLLQNMARYGEPGEAPAIQLDVRDLWTREEQQKKGKLTEVATVLGVEKGTAHRALGDVLTTATIFEAMVSARGLSWLKQIVPETFGQGKYVRKLPVSPVIAAIREALASGKQLTPETLAEISRSKRIHGAALSFSVSEMLKTGEITLDQCADPRCQTAIHGVLERALEIIKPESGEKSVRLKPLKEILDILNGQNNDYNQIRVALATRKERGQEAYSR